MLDKPSNLQITLCASDDDAAALRAAGLKSVLVVRTAQDVCRTSADGEAVIDDNLTLFDRFVLAMPVGAEQLRDDLAVRLGDEICRWISWPNGLRGPDHVYREEGADGLRRALADERPMWTDEVATIDDVPEPADVVTYTTGFPALDEHGLRLVLPAFMPVIGPYGSGKSVLLRQLLVNLWKLHGWRFLLTSFEERIKPRYQRDLRRHLIGRPEAEWSEIEIAHADGEIRNMARFLRRPRNAVLDLDRLLNRIEFAVRVHGVRVVAIDPVNEIDHQVPKGESRTDYMGRFIMRLKALADDYDLLMIVCAHPPKDGAEKRLQKTGLLTLYDGADTAHWGNKADIGWCVWRNIDGPTLLHIDKLKDHETMGSPTLAELHLDKSLNQFRVARIGYDILEDAE